MSQIKAVIFDLGGVLIRSPMELWKEFEKQNSLEEGSILEVVMSEEVKPHFQLLESGATNCEDFESLFTYFYNKQTGRENPSVLTILTSKLWEEFSSVNEDLEGAVKVLRTAGLKTALLTNNFFMDRAHLRPTIPSGQHFLDLFDVVVESCRVGLRKPDEKIYKLILNKLNVSPNEAVFLDDIGTNLKPAQKLGIRTIKVTSTEQAVRDLTALVGQRLDIPSETRTVLERESLDESQLRSYLASLNVPNGELVVRKFKHGQSNPTYYIRQGQCEFVLRKKPSGKLLPKAHQVDREFRILKALSAHIPVPKVIDYNEGLLDQPFYLMEYKKGRIFTDPSIPGVSVAERKEIYDEAIKVLAKIHTVDFEKAGLGDYGRKDGYMERNLKRWISNYELAKTEENPEIDRLIEYLKEHLPTNAEARIVHGDFRIDNLMFHPTENRVIAVLDWEISTIGDPLSDLATFMFGHYNTANSKTLPGLGQFSEIQLQQMGIPTVTQAIDTYCKALGRPPLSVQEWTPYISFVAFRMAAILQGVYMRSLMNNASNTNAGKLASVPRRMAAHALNIVRQVEETKQYGNLAVVPSILSAKAQKLYHIVKRIVHEDIIPMETELMEYYEGPSRWTPHPALEKIKEKARSLGAWNMFIAEHIDPEGKYGVGLSNVEYAHICELLGRSVFAPEIFNCQAPDTGNMEVLIKYGTEEQKEKWLKPLLAGKMKSCFAMTEPDVASSDATNIQGNIVNAGDRYIINARKWFTTNAAHPDCKICVFMGQVAGQSTKSRLTQQSMILVPMTAPGVKIVRNLHVLGAQDPPSGHCEVLFTNVSVPIDNMLLGEGRGFEIAQGRLGPGRIHHAMRLIGHAERALDIMKERVAERIAFRRPLIKFDSIRQDVAQSRIEIEQARLLVLKAAHMIDTVGSKDAQSEIAMIKVVAPNMCLSVVDRAIQTLGGKGLTIDTPLSAFYIAARSLRLADGPDAVHLETICKREMNSKL